ncbi:MAG TPA: hypothetical protein PKX25_06330, partial [Microthrixaceae bacterium]|nr:hypothetical protein [Microthrixaceae bacterium]
GAEPGLPPLEQGSQAPHPGQMGRIGLGKPAAALLPRGMGLVDEILRHFSAFHAHLAALAEFCLLPCFKNIRFKDI